MRMLLLIVLTACVSAADANAEDASNIGSVTLSPAQIAARGIVVSSAVRDASTEVIAMGRVAFDPDRISFVGPQLPAKVVSVVRKLGDHVEAGDLVAVFESVEIGKARARHLALRAAYDAARAASTREDQLAAQQISSEAERLEARARLRSAEAELRANVEELRLYGVTARGISEIGTRPDERLSLYPLYAPIAGTIEVRDISPGQSVGADVTPIEVVDIDRMTLVVDAAEGDIGRLSTGQTVHFVPRALPTQTFDGTIEWISNALDPSTRTLRLQAAIDNPTHLLKADMYGEARIVTATRDDSVWLPQSAVQTLRGVSVVFREEAEGTFEAISVQTGRQVDERIEIERGIEPGQHVVTTGAFALVSLLTTTSAPDVD
jgi:membrane fusion protein, heavy metal efflux system